MTSDSFYIELSIDEKSDPAKQSIKLFAIPKTNAAQMNRASSREMREMRVMIDEVIVLCSVFCVYKTV